MHEHGIEHTWLNPLGRSYCNEFNVSQYACGPVSYMYMLPIVESVRETAENEDCYQADVLRPICRVVGKIATIVISGVHLSSELSYLQPTSHSYKPLPWNHVYHQGRAMWCQLPTSPVLWPQHWKKYALAILHSGMGTPPQFRTNFRGQKVTVLERFHCMQMV